METHQRTNNKRPASLKIYTQLMRAGNSVTEKMHRHLLEEKLSISQFGVLEALHHLGPLCQKEIGTKILKTSGNMTLVIDNLEKRQLVMRKKDPGDRRRMIITLTEEGSELIRKIFPRHARTAETVFGHLSSEELETLGRLLKKLGKQESSSVKTG